MGERYVCFFAENQHISFKKGIYTEGSFRMFFFETLFEK
jgi:hypothetical protein